jgi:hypothetical protein
MLVFNYFNGYDATPGEIKYLTKISFGNMGYSSNICSMNFINWSVDETNFNI